MSSEKLKVFLATFVLTAAVGTTSVAQAEPLEISDAPLFVVTAVDPNIMMLLDDSGSMRFGFMPGELDRYFDSNGNASVDFYCPDEWWKGSWYEACDTEDDGMAFLTSSHLNNIYFDPSKEYEPPLKPDGTRYADMPFNNAKLDGYTDEECGDVWCVDLRSEFIAQMDDYYYGNEYNEGFAVSPDSDEGPAFYYQHKG